MRFPFYGRTRELERLDQLLKIAAEGSAQMAVVTGRRRIGKTTLIRKSAERHPDVTFLYFYVNALLNEEDNVRNFLDSNGDKLGLAGLSVSMSMRDLLKFLLTKATATPLILVFDEFQNFERVSPAFFGELQNFWDQYHNKARMLLILSGSVASVMREVTESPSAPLFGRPSAFIRLSSFSLSTMKTIYESCFMKAPGNQDKEDFLALWTLTGGVPKYIQLLAEQECRDKASMFAYAVDPSSFFVNEGTVLLHTEFKSDYATYFKILSLAAKGKTKRQEFVSAFPDRDISGQLFRLENHYRLLHREMPFGSSDNVRNYRLTLDDEFLRFWFRYIYPFEYLIESNASDKIVQIMLNEFPDFTGRYILERYFRKQLLETGNYSEAAPWWDRKGLNEIDIVGLNPFDKELLFIEVKREAKKINLDALKDKTFIFLQNNPTYRHYSIRTEGRSLDDL